MFGLSAEEWRDLVLSVNTRRPSRRLSPIQAARAISRALEVADSSVVASELNLKDDSTLRRIARIGELPPELSALVDWGNRRGCLSMSSAAELLRLSSRPEALREAILAGVQHDLSKDEARQLVQLIKRGANSVDDAVQGVLKTRPRIERSELILGSLISKPAADYTQTAGNEQAARRIGLAFAAEFPAIVPKAFRINGDRFSLLLTEQDAKELRAQLGPESVERAITRLTEGLVGGGTFDR